VLLHLKLPNISGLDVLRRIRDDERTRRLPVVIPTSSNKAQDPISGYDLVANSYVRKPVDVTALADAARQLGMYWLLLNEAPPIRSH
jgi:two-component system response regulator